MVDVILGLQWGDEGKGKIVDYFAPHYDVITRFQGGPNAGHTLYIEGKKIVLHQIPSGIFHTNNINLIGGGVVLDVITLKKECETVIAFGIDVHKKLYISNRAHLIIPTHIALDKAAEAIRGKEKIGSTLKGIAPAYMDKMGRSGLRMGDIHHKDFDKQYQLLRTKHLKQLENLHYTENINQLEEAFLESIEFARKLPVVNSAYFLNKYITKGKKILAEETQKTMLDIDFGTFPFVTSSNTITASVCTGLGIAPNKINEVIGVTKAYCTRVGGGPFPTELNDGIGEKLRTIGNEFGSTTNRPRRCGWLDLVALKYACMLNGISKVVMTKIDVLDNFQQLQVCTDYKIDDTITKEMPYNINNIPITPIYKNLDGWDKKLSTCTTTKQLPEGAKKYIQYIEQYLKIPITYLSNGVMKEQIIRL